MSINDFTPMAASAVNATAKPLRTDVPITAALLNVETDLPAFRAFVSIAVSCVFTLPNSAIACFAFASTRKTMGGRKLFIDYPLPKFFLTIC